LFGGRLIAKLRIVMGVIFRDRLERAQLVFRARTPMFARGIKRGEPTIVQAQRHREVRTSAGVHAQAGDAQFF
jgi:hypothetical protein